MEINNSFEITIREVTDTDLELLMAWRSNPLIYKFFYIQKKPLKWQEHHSWWISRVNRRDWMILIKERNITRRVGSVNITRLDTDNPEVGVFIGELCLWGKNIGRCAVLHVLKWAKSMAYKRAYARIIENNIGSIKLFESLGFKKTKKGRVGEWVYEKDL
jgi:RimJ/RimL family protein N-acetyltransferase